MKLPTSKYLKNKARIRLEEGQQPKQVVLCYAGISAALTLAVNLVQYYVDHQMSLAGGLQNIGTRSILETITNILPIVQAVVMMCVTLGYTAAILRIARRQFASPKTLKAGMQRFWVLLRTRILTGLILFGIAFGLSYAAIAIFMLTPLSGDFNALIAPLVTSGSFSMDAILSNDALMTQLTYATLPMSIIYLILLLPVCLLVSYVYRFTDYILIDQPGCRAREAMRRSRELTRGNLFGLFKLDLSFWWYHLLRCLTAVITYSGMILAFFGIQVSYFVILAAFLAADAAITILFRNKPETAFALAYDTLLPKEKQEGLVLGNIFQME